MITLLIIAFVTLVSIIAFKNPALHRQLTLNPYRFWKQKKYYQSLTSGFVHKDAVHLIMNMYVLFIFGTTVELGFSQIYTHGIFAYILLFISGIVVSSLIDIFLKKDEPNFYTLGASGGVSSVVFASITVFPMDKVGIILIPVMIPGYIFGFLYLAYCIFKDYQQNDNINHMAHFVGGLWGVLFMILTWAGAIPNFIHQMYGG